MFGKIRANNNWVARTRRRIRLSFNEGLDQSGSRAHHVNLKPNTGNHTGPVNDYKSMLE